MAILSVVVDVKRLAILQHALITISAIQAVAQECLYKNIAESQNLVDAAPLWTSHVTTSTACASLCCNDFRCMLCSYMSSAKLCSAYGNGSEGDGPAENGIAVMKKLPQGSVCATARDLVDDVADSKLTASSIYTTRHSSERARLGTAEDSNGEGAWSAGSSDGNQFIQVEFDNVKRVTGIATKGRNQVRQHNQWVTSYSVAYRADCSNWRTIGDSIGNTKVFDGNTDTNSLVVHNLTTPVRARFVRLLPVEWHVYVSMRFGIIGCDIVRIEIYKHLFVDTGSRTGDGVVTPLPNMLKSEFDGMAIDEYSVRHHYIRYHSHLRQTVPLKFLQHSLDTTFGASLQCHVMDMTSRSCTTHYFRIRLKTQQSNTYIGGNEDVLDNGQFTTKRQYHNIYKVNDEVSHAN
ncbi:hypothetical protein ScPMuIL_016757 [Solemya velum]